jgi:hypothetical protein
VTQPRAPDDFLLIRARMEELRRERARPRAPDDFRTIRVRMGSCATRAPRIARSAGPFGDPSEALSPDDEHETEDEGRQHSPRVTSGPELSGSFIRLLHRPKRTPPSTLSWRSSGQAGEGEQAASG